jgi:putative ABC transport system permease protein
MILFMATFTALTGFGPGIGLVTLLITVSRARMPNHAAIVTYGNVALAFARVVVIAAASSWIGIRRVLRIAPFDIFRG